MKARDLMTAHQVWAASETATARQVARIMVDHDVGAIPVLDARGRLEGIVTDRDLCCKVLALGRGADTPVREVMTDNPCAIHAETSLEQIESLMREHKIRRLPVVDDENRLQGFVSLADIARCCNTSDLEHELAEILETVSAP